MPTTLMDYYPPIAAAAFVFALWFVVAWRFSKRETPGNESFRHIAWLLVLIGPLLWFLWSRGFDTPLSSYFDRFMGALGGVSMGALGVFLVHDAFFSQHETRWQQFIKLAYVVGFVTLTGAGFFI